MRYQGEKSKAYRILDLTSLTVDEFEQLVAPFEAAFVRYMQHWTMEGKPRTGRRYSQYANCPLPSPEDRVLFILSYLKVAALQVAHGALFGMTQSNANKWIHVLLAVLHQTLIDLGDLPARHLQVLKQRLTALNPPPSDAAEAAAPPPPALFFTMAPSARSRAPTIPLSKKRVIAARKSGTL
jgi:Helix-turn-helix of DDE superfamily endonuclease